MRRRSRPPTGYLYLMTYWRCSDGESWINNWKTTLSAGLSPGELSLTVPDAAAALLPLSGGNWVLLTLADDAGAQHEIVKATARAGGVVTIDRAQEGTSDGNWPAGTAIYAPSRPATS